MKHVITHSLSLEAAKKATVSAFDSYAERFAKYNPRANWKTDEHAEVAFTAKSVTLGGDIRLREGEVELEMSVPLLFRPFRAKAMEVIEAEIRLWIDKAESGEI